MNDASIARQIKALQERLARVVEALGFPAGSPTVPLTEARNLLDISGELKEVLDGVIHDLAESSRFREENPNPILRVNGEGVVLYANDAGRSLLQGWQCSVGARAPEDLRAAVADVLTDRLSRVVEVDSGERPYSFAASPVPAIGFVDLYGLDIAGYGPEDTRQRSEGQNWQDKFAIDHAVYVVDQDQRIVNANLAMRNNFPGMELIGERCCKLVHGTDQPPDFCPSCRIFGSGVAEHFEHFEPHMGDRWFDVSAYPLRGAGGFVRQIVHVLRDITEHKRLERQFVQAQKMEAVGRLAGGVAHDFNNILTVIVGACGFLRESLRPDHPAMDDIEQIAAAAGRATALTRQLLTFSHRQADSPRIVDINELLRGLSKMLRRLIREDVELVIMTEDVLCLARVDPGQFEQVVCNLAVNASDAMPAGGKLTIRTRSASDGDLAQRLGSQPAAAEYVLVDVIDTGVGMARDLLEHIFEPFFTTKEAGKGTGLGLATCYGIVQQIGGHILVESREGSGSTFSIYLPMEHGDPDALADEDTSHTVLRGTETILVVEDESHLRRFIRKSLQDRGFSVLEAGNGEEAIRVIESCGYSGIDLVLTDMVMPVMGGYDLSRRLGASMPGVKILFMSGYPSEMSPARGVASGGRGNMIQKPFTRDDLVQRIRDVLDLS